MWLGDSDHTVEATPSNAVFLRYMQLDILNGLLIHTEVGRYYVHADDAGYQENREQLQEEGVRTQIIEGEFNPHAPPHRYVLAFVEQMLVEEAERITRDVV